LECPIELARSPQLQPERTSGKLKMQPNATAREASPMPGVQPSSVSLRETIRHSAEGERKYIRYFDGRGHFGHVRLLLIPHPGERCTVTIDSACTLPKEACDAASEMLLQRFDRGRHGLLPLIGFEVRLTGGTYLAPYSYLEACAIAASMAYDEALLRAGLFVVEFYAGIRLFVEIDALSRTIRTLRDLLGEVRATSTVTKIVQLDVEIPVRLCGAVKAALGLRVLNMIPLPKDQQYQPLASAAQDPHGLSGGFDEWT
jgi:hypothetical protein